MKTSHLLREAANILAGLPAVVREGVVIPVGRHAGSWRGVITDAGARPVGAVLWSEWLRSRKIVESDEAPVSIVCSRHGGFRQDRQWMVTLPLGDFIRLTRKGGAAAPPS